MRQCHPSCAERDKCHPRCCRNPGLGEAGSRLPVEASGAKSLNPTSSFRSLLQIQDTHRKSTAARLALLRLRPEAGFSDFSRWARYGASSEFVTLTQGTKFAQFAVTICSGFDMIPPRVGGVFRCCPLEKACAHYEKSSA